MDFFETQCTALDLWSRDAVLGDGGCLHPDINCIYSKTQKKRRLAALNHEPRHHRVSDAVMGDSKC